MKTKIHSFIPAIFCCLMAGASLTLAQGTAFMYQGRLNNTNVPATGSFDFQFTLFSANSNGVVIAGPVTNSATGVTNGLFTAIVDFGNPFSNAVRWLEMAVRTNGGGAFSTLSPRQQIMPVPVSIFAETAGTAGTAAGVAANSVTAAAILDGTVTASKIAGGQVVKSLNGLTDTVLLSAGANITLAPSGNTIQIASSGGVPSGWALGGNGGTQGTNYLGTSDNLPLELKVNGSRALRLEPNASGAPNVIGGSSANFVAAGVKGAVIGGGGATNYAGTAYTNSVAADFSTVGGGYYNSIQTGAFNSTIPGGAYNAVAGSYGFAAGHRAKAMHNGAFVWADFTDADFSSATTNEFAIRATGGVRLSDSTPGLSFGFTTRQMLNLFGTGYGIGVQNYTLYQRTDANGGFAWYQGGSHTNTQDNPGGGGVTLMTLDSGGNLAARGAGTFGGVVTGKGFLGGVHGIASGIGWGVYGESGSGIGVRGNITGVDAAGYGGTGVDGSSAGTSGVGVSGSCTGASGIGVYGTGNAWAGYFQGDVSVIGSFTVSSAFTAVEGVSSGNDGVYGLTSIGDTKHAGVVGANSAAFGTGVIGNALNTDSAGVAGIGDTARSTGVYGRGTKWGGYFDGPVSVCSLEIRGGCDVAEPFPMSHQEIPKGSVVVIDDASTGQLKLSDRAYDTRVAGIVSGANGINPGIALHQDGAFDGGQNVALSGRVYVLADASNGPIKAGDLLTTSSTPGHAMKVTDHLKAQGTIIGKAMSALKEGKGMVLVLVTLQ